MNPFVKKLYQLAGKPSRNIIGLMSGTSLDGLDIALCNISGSGGDTQVVLQQFTTVEFDPFIKTEIRKVFAQRHIDFQHLCLLHPFIGRMHGEMINQSLAKWNISAEHIDLVASHGQTVFHAPKIQHQIEGYDNATLQIGDGDHLAATTGIITLSDFRMRHIAAGGEGAPLAVYGDYFVFSKPGEDRILLNMGGIANFTFLAGDMDASKVFTSDTGPGNTLLDVVTRRYFPGKEYDEDGKLAFSGEVLPILLSVLKDQEFFIAPFPKTTGPEVFNMDFLERAQAITHTQDARPQDLLRTLVQLSAETISAGIQSTIGSRPTPVYMSGGGMHNPALVTTLQTLLPQCIFRKTDELGIPGDAKEAVLFAILANEAVAGGTTFFGNRHKVPSVSMGKISWPA